MTSQKDLGPFRWMPDSTGGQRVPATGATMAAQLRSLVGIVRALPKLTPPPGVFPRATIGVELGERTQPQSGSLMLGFWPPESVALRGGQLIPTSAIIHLMVYVNKVREEVFSQDKWEDAQGRLLPEPKRVGELQGFPIYAGFGGLEVSGTLVVLPPGRSLFVPVAQERFHRFAIGQLEKQLKEAQPALVRAQQLYSEATSAAGQERRKAQRAQSLEDYRKKRPRTPEQLAYREKELEKLDADELERLRVDATPEGNRLTGYLSKDLAAAKARFAALSPTERAAPAWHLPDSRNPVAHPVPPQTPSATPIVTFARWDNPARPRSAWQVITVERYWACAEAVRRGLDRSPRNLPDHLNKEVVEALDWQAIARRFLA